MASFVLSAVVTIAVASAVVNIVVVVADKIMIK